MSLSWPELCALATALLWASHALLLRNLTQSVAPATVTAIRCGAAGAAYLVLLPFDAPLSALALVPWQEWALLLVSLTAGLVVGDTIYLVALRDIGVARAMPVSGTFPLSTLLFERLLLGTPLRPSLLAGSLLVGAGIVLLSRGRARGADDELPRPLLLRGVLLASTAALLWGFSVTLLKPALANLSIVQANAVRFPVVALLLWLFVVRPSGAVLAQLTGRAWMIAVGTGLAGFGLGAYLFLTALEQIGPAKAVTLTSASPLFGVLLAMLFLGERPGPSSLAGALCCLAGVYTVL